MQKEIVEKELDDLLASFDTGPDANYSTAFLDQFITEMGGSGPVSESPRVITPFKPPPDVLASSGGKGKEKEPRVGDTWKPVKVDEAKTGSERSLDSLFDLKQFVQAEKKPQTMVPARPFQPAPDVPSGAAPISLDSPEDIAALERELGIAPASQPVRPQSNFAKPVVGTQPSPMPVPAPGSAIRSPSQQAAPAYAIQGDEELTQLLQEISPATIKFVGPAPSKPSATSIFAQPGPGAAAARPADRGQVIPTRPAQPTSEPAPGAVDLNALLDDLTFSPSLSSARSASTAGSAHASSAPLKSSPSALAAAAAATRNAQAQQSRPAQPAPRAQPAAPPVSVESIDDLDAIERALMGEVVPTGFETIRPKATSPRGAAPARSVPPSSAPRGAPAAVPVRSVPPSAVQRPPAKAPAPMPDVMDVFNSLDQVISVSEELMAKDRKSVAPAARQGAAPLAAGAGQAGRPGLQSAASAVAPRSVPIATESLATESKSTVTPSSAMYSPSPAQSSGGPKTQPPPQLVAGSITPSYLSGWNSGVPAVDTYEKTKKNLDLLLGPSPADIAQHKQRNEQAKKEEDDLSDLISQLDSEAEKEKTAKQQAEEERRKREEEIASKKQQHLEALESLIDQLEIPDDEPLPTIASSHSTVSKPMGPQSPAIAELVATESQRKSASSPAALRERQEYDMIQRKMKELASMTGQPLWSGKEGSKLDTKAVTSIVKQTVDQAKTLADSSTISPERREGIISYARECVASLGPFFLAIKAFDEMLDDMRAYRRPTDRTEIESSIRNIQALHNHMMRAYEIVLESYIYTNGIGSGKGAPSSRPPDAPADLGLPVQKPQQEFTAEQARNAILYSFRDFYQNTAPPPPDVGYLGYTPWTPLKSMREYCSEAVQLFKPIIEHVNIPFLSFNFRSFSDLITKEIELLVPIAKIIQQDRIKYAAFDKFPLGIKVFINAVIVFIEAVNVYKQSGTYASSVELATANHRKDELSNALKMLLATIRKLIGSC